MIHGLRVGAVPAHPDSDSKSVISQVEHAEPSNHTAKQRPDYSGATAKSDPREIALVKKLDRRILPMLWAMYFLNYVRMINSHNTAISRTLCSNQMGPA